MFTRDVAPIDEWNFYGQHPFLMCVNDDHVFAIYMHNSNAQEWVLSPKPGEPKIFDRILSVKFFQHSRGAQLAEYST